MNNAFFSFWNKGICYIFATLKEMLNGQAGKRTGRLIVIGGNCF